MFDNGAQIKGSQECRIDPEKMLQRARERKEVAQRADALLIELTQMPLDLYRNGCEESVITLLGSVRVLVSKAEKEEQDWLDEINKG